MEIFCGLDLYRFGNFTGPRLDHVRPFKDVTVAVMNGISIIVANRNWYIADIEV